MLFFIILLLHSKFLYIYSKEKSNFVFFIHLHDLIPMAIHVPSVMCQSVNSIPPEAQGRKHEHISLMLYLDGLSKILKYDTEKKNTHPPHQFRSGFLSLRVRRLGIQNVRKRDLRIKTDLHQPQDDPRGVPKRRFLGFYHITSSHANA